MGIDELFWEITLEPAGRPGPLAEELGNLPAWDSPDVFADSCDLIGTRGGAVRVHCFKFCVRKEKNWIFKNFNYISYRQI